MRYLFTLACLLSTLMVAKINAEGKIYKNVDPQGSTSFSDQPTPGAAEVEVKPNVINVTPVQPLPPSTAKPAKPAKQKQPDELQPVEVTGQHHIDADTEDRVYVYPRADPKKVKKIKEALSDHKKGPITIQPVPNRPILRN
ncbi:DUF4124 domain-containing protein [Aestuariirhabdus sp. Z084]|uniref:DUF4124 domain-containing protein n=1 Tax=Aestuariirhabdus haliotis TaxID=2918751 RepID=UPI00201B41E5|nr:DUF4124 domain-containing protein [Aestuariirhabdus haliotis]MCL6415843.1 DUF4124 domain-containing protein [Aestuariirhabdus haliotis]MCL6419855.1 DUF4124 domain-containing protein [Aestuariirhabdus haliotis]